MSRAARIGRAVRAVARARDAALDATLDHANGSDRPGWPFPDVHARARAALRMLRHPPMDPRRWGLYPRHGVLP